MKENWTYKPFMECIEKVKYTTKIQSKDFAEVGKYPIISQEDTYISGYWNNEADVFRTIRPLVIFGDHTRVLKYIDFDFVLGADGVKILLPIQEIMAKFMYYYIQWYKIPNLGYSRHFKLFQDIKFPMAPMSTQQAIVRELDGINEVLSKKREQLKELDKLAQSIFYDMFGDPVTNEKGWEVKKLANIAVKITDGSHNPPKGIVESPYRMISSQNIIEGKIDYTKDLRYLSEHDFLQENKRTNLKTGDVLLTIVGTVGRCCIVTSRDKGITLQRSVAVISPKYELINSQFIIGVLNAYNRKFIEEAHGAAQKGIYLGQLNEQKIPLPPLALQQAFAEKIEKIEQTKQNLKASIHEAETLLASRMSYWFE